MTWPMRKERELIQLARAILRVEQISTKMKFAPAAIVKAGRRLGLHLPPIRPKLDGRLKAKGK